MLRDTDTAVSYNPVASPWKGNAVADALTLAVHGIRFGLGTDATRGDGFRLMDAAEAAQRLAFGARTGRLLGGGGWTWLDHATAAGADAAGLRGVTGDIAVGMAADFLARRPRRARVAAPSWDLEWELVRLDNRDQIVAVFVDGRCGCGEAGRSTGTPGS